MVSPPPKPSACGKRPGRQLPFPLRGVLHPRLRTPGHGEAHVILSRGEPGRSPVPLVRIHSQCLTGDTLGSLRCDCGQQLHRAGAHPRAECGLPYDLSPPGGPGHRDPQQTQRLRPARTAGPTPWRPTRCSASKPTSGKYGAYAEILRWFGVDGIRLMSNNPAEIEAMEKAGIRVMERVPLQVEPVASARAYLQTRRRKWVTCWKICEGKEIRDGDRPVNGKRHSFLSSDSCLLTSSRVRLVPCFILVPAYRDRTSGR